MSNGIESKKSEKVPASIWLIVFGLYILTGTNGWTNSVTQKLIENFPDISRAVVRTAATAGSISGFVTGILTGRFVGRKIRYRTAVLAGLTCMIIGGCGPVFFHSEFWMIWICKFLFGCGAMCHKMSQPMIRRIAGSKEAGKWMSIAMACTTGLSVIMQNVAGRLSDIRWYYIYAVYFVLLIPLVINIFTFKEPEHLELSKAPAVGEEPPKGLKALFLGVPKKIILYIILIMFATLINYTIITQVSSYVAYRGWGEGAIAALVGSMYTIGGFVGSLLYSGVTKLVTRRWVMTFAFALNALGFFVVLISPSIYVCIIGCFMCGFAYTTNSVSNSANVVDLVPPNIRTWCFSLTSIGITAASFGSAFYTSLVNKMASTLTFLDNDVARAYVVSAVIAAVFAVITVVVNPSEKERDD